MFDFIKKLIEKKGNVKVNYFEQEQNNWKEENKNLFYDNYEFFNNNCCPNCGVVLNSEIKTSKKCSECKEKIVVRTNPLTKEKLLLCEKDLKKYESNDNKRKEINFCSNLIKNTSFVCNDIGKKLNKLKKEKPDLSVRDYTWNILMNLSNELTNDGLKKYNKIVNLPYRDRALEVFDVVKTFEKSNLAFDRMVSLAEYEHKDNVLITMLPQAIHLGISTQYIYALPKFQMNLDEERICQLDCCKILYDYLNRNNMTIDDFKPIYLEHAKNLIIPTITPDLAWMYVKRGYNIYKTYNEQKNVN